jgi:hypothetical protein
LAVGGHFGGSELVVLPKVLKKHGFGVGRRQLTENVAAMRLSPNRGHESTGTH